jgi:alpha-L-fucosidase
VYKNQKDAIIFSDGGPGCRWVGNENGYAGETNWNTLNGDKVFPGYPNFKELTLGHEDGTHWIPAESDVSIRPGWFYSPDTDGKVKTVEQLMDIYMGSVGRGSNLLLNVPVNREGLISREDSVRLLEFGAARKKMFSKNLAVSATVKYSGKTIKTLTDNNPETYWVGKPGKETTIEVEWPQSQSINYVVLREQIALGQRVKEFSIDVIVDGKYKEAVKATTIGHKLILQMIEQSTSKIRIRITQSKAVPVLQEIEVY